MSTAYRVGTVTATNGSSTIVGANTLWSNQINPGDLFTLDFNVFYEALAVTDDTHITLDRPFTGTTTSASAYAFIRTFTIPTTGQLAQRMSALIQTYSDATNAILGGIFPDGSPALPSFKFQGSQNTGFSRGLDPLNGTTTPTESVYLSYNGQKSYRIMSGTLDRGFSPSGHEYIRENWGAFGRNDLTNRYNDGTTDRLSSPGAATILIRSTISGGGQFAFGISQSGNENDPITWGYPLRLTMAQALFNTSVASDPASDALFADSIGLGPLGNGQILWINGNPANNNANITSNYSGSAGVRVAAGYSCQIHLDTTNGSIVHYTSDNNAAGTTIAARNPTLTVFPTGAVAIGYPAISGTGEALTVVSTALNSPPPTPNSTLVVFASSVTGCATAAVLRNCDVGPQGGPASVLLIGKQSSNGRSISVAGTIGAPGADYAEWRMRAPNISARTPGEVVGYDLNGKITNIWTDARTFGIISTSPSIIGGDPDIKTIIGVAPTPPAMPQPPAGADGMPNSADPAYQAQMVQYRTALASYQTAEAAHQADIDSYMARFELIALSGHVPVNGTYSAAQAGDYVIAVQDGTNIKGQLVTRAQMKADQTQMFDVVGRVRSIFADGRPELSVMQG